MAFCESIRSNYEKAGIRLWENLHTTRIPFSSSPALADIQTHCMDPDRVSYGKLYCVNAERNTSAFYSRLFSAVPSMASFSVNVLQRNRQLNCFTVTCPLSIPVGKKMQRMPFSLFFELRDVDLEKFKIYLRLW